MATRNAKAAATPFCMTITFEIDPADEIHFNDVYDNDHVPTIMKLPGMLEVIRDRDAKASEKGFLVYTALYLYSTENLHETPEWKVLSDQGRWAPDIRPKLKSRARRAGPVIARFSK